jgi:hypothetical protein
MPCQPGEVNNFRVLQVRQHVALRDWQQPGEADCCKTSARRRQDCDRIESGRPGGIARQRRPDFRNNANGFAFSAQ